MYLNKEFTSTFSLYSGRMWIKSGMIFNSSSFSLCHLKGERNIRHMMILPPQSWEIWGNHLPIRSKWARQQPFSFTVKFVHFVVLAVSRDAHEWTLSLWTPSNLQFDPFSWSIHTHRKPLLLPGEDDPRIGSEIATISYCFICWDCAHHDSTNTITLHEVSIYKTSREETGLNNFCNYEPEKCCLHLVLHLLDPGWKRSHKFPVLIQLVKCQTRTPQGSSW